MPACGVFLKLLQIKDQTKDFLQHEGINKLFDDSENLLTTLQKSCQNFKNLNYQTISQIISIVKSYTTYPKAFDYLDSEKDKSLLLKIIQNIESDKKTVNLFYDNIDLLISNTNAFKQDYKGKTPLFVAFDRALKKPSIFSDTKKHEEVQETFIKIAARILFKIKEYKSSTEKDFNIEEYFKESLIKHIVQIEQQSDETFLYYDAEKMIQNDPKIKLISKRIINAAKEMEQDVKSEKEFKNWISSSSSITSSIASSSASSTSGFTDFTTIHTSYPSSIPSSSTSSKTVNSSQTSSLSKENKKPGTEVKDPSKNQVHDKEESKLK